MARYIDGTEPPIMWWRILYHVFENSPLPIDGVGPPGAPGFVLAGKAGGAFFRGGFYKYEDFIYRCERRCLFPHSKVLCVVQRDSRHGWPQAAHEMLCVAGPVWERK